MDPVHLEDDKLQRYFDEELSEGEAKVVRRHVDECDECSSRLSSLGKLHDLIHLAAEEMASSAELDKLFANVRSGIESGERAGFGERLRVLTSETIQHRKPVWVPLASAIAAAAAVLLVVFFSQGGSPDGATDAAMRLVIPAPGSEVVGVDFGANTGTVFEVEGGNGTPVAVVWINDDEPAEAPPGTP